MSEYLSRNPGSYRLRNVTGPAAIGTLLKNEVMVNMILPRSKTYRARSLERRLLALRKADKQGIAAAERAERIIAFLAKGQAEMQKISNKLTKHGELRLRNCLKFDLGGGYRLVCITSESFTLFLPVAMMTVTVGWRISVVAN